MSFVDKSFLKSQNGGGKSESFIVLNVWSSAAELMSLLSVWYQCGISVWYQCLAAFGGDDRALEVEDCARGIGRKRNGQVLKSFKVEATCQLVLDVPRRVSILASSQRLENI